MRWIERVGHSKTAGYGCRPPQSSVGALLPVLLCDEQSTLIAYLVEEHDVNWDGKNVGIVSPHGDGEGVAVVRFVRASARMFGPPNDEAFAGHPLASRGLEPYGAFEVIQPSWIRNLERMNSVHSYHRAEAFRDLRHFMLTFHDSTIECVAHSVEVVEVFRGSVNEAISRMARLTASPRR